MDYFNKYKLYTEYFTNLLDSKKIELLNRYFKSLINNAMPKGFIGEGGEEEIWLRHILDSVLILQKHELVDVFMKSNVVIDLGAGAGLPGIPLAIVFPETKFVLVEAMEKRAKYITEIKSELNLNNVRVINKRVEDVKSDDFTGKARLILFRAFLKPLVSLEMALRVMPRVMPRNAERINAIRLKNATTGEANGEERSKVLYWRSRRFDISGEPGAEASSQDQQVNSRIHELGYGVPVFYSLECPPEMNSRGVYLMEHSGNFNDTGAKYPRSWTRIKNDVFINNIG
jgi:16S rRNA (guanine(527)-N(7))-methyltransferase RsmG